jgi:hypothetical protein
MDSYVPNAGHRDVNLSCRVGIVTGMSDYGRGSDW